MVNKLYFDIETLPADGVHEKTLRLLHEKKVTKKQKRDPAVEAQTFEEFWDGTGTDGTYGRICCIGFAMNDDRVEAISGPENERKMLIQFWDIAAKADLLVGHNIRDFDLPFIMQRSVILGVKPTWKITIEPGESKFRLPPGVKFLDFARYTSCPVYDTMWEWSHWVDKWNNKSIEHIALALGIPTPKEGIDGSQVNEFFKAGKLEDICNYCKRDVETVRAVYKRMIFESVPETETLPF
ncbi:ribonuclease H-like domain-containing protein [Candidatus Parcubacteria bacterium]|nr:ribonuclease H-like domain-containing protein [Candidatus Parcubacteria bacterium]